MTFVNTETGELTVASREERTAVARLTTAIAALTEAVDFMPISEVSSLKAQVATIQTATKELGMSREAQELAAEAVRRAEWALGRAMRSGQANGTVRKSVDTLRQNRSDHMEERPESPDAYTQPGRERDAIYRMADLEPSDFDDVLGAARAEGNLSRTNVARLAREKAGTAPTTDPTARAYQEADVVNAFRSMARELTKPKNVASLTPKARTLLVELLEHAIATLKGTDQ